MKAGIGIFCRVFAPMVLCAALLYYVTYIGFYGY